MSVQVNFKDLVQKIIETYTSIFNKQDLNTATQSNFILQTIDFLKDLSTKNVQFDTWNVDQNQIYNFFLVLLNSPGMIAATGGNFDNFSLGDTQQLGRKKDCRGVLRSKNEDILDWMCSVLFQGREDSVSFSDDKGTRCKGRIGEAVWQVRAQ
jgi:hypothetical protein